MWIIVRKAIWHKNKCDKVVVVDDLLNANYHIDFDKDLYGLYLPKEEILKRTKYNLVFTIELKYIMRIQ